MYIFENFNNKKSIEEMTKINLRDAIISTKQDLNSNINNYEFAEGDLIDYYLYQIKANKSKLSYLVKEAKKYNAKPQNKSGEGGGKKNGTTNADGIC